MNKDLKEGGFLNTTIIKKRIMRLPSENDTRFLISKISLQSKL